VKFFGVTDVGPGLFLNRFDRIRVQRAHASGEGVVGPTQADGPGTTFFQRRIVEKGIGVCIEDFMGHGRGRRRIDGIGNHLACTNIAKE